MVVNSMENREKLIRKLVCLFMCFVVLLSTHTDNNVWALKNIKTESKTDLNTKNETSNKKSKKSKKLYKKGSIFLDQALGFKKFDALKAVNKYFNANWNEGLHYNGAIYHGLNSYNVGTNINYNFKTNKQYKYRDKNGYGYNCTGVVTSVMYYASETEKSIPEYYEDLINGKGLGRICNGFAWWDYFNRHNVKKYCAGRVSNNADVDKVLNKEKKLKTGYVIYFAPTVRGGDCHLGFYWGKNAQGNHMMRHCIWRGFEWSKAFPGARGTYDLYLLPLSTKKTGVVKKKFKITIKRKVKKTKNENGEYKALSLRGDTYDFYTKRSAKGLSKRLVHKKKIVSTKKILIKRKKKTKKKSKKKAKKKYKIIKKTKIKDILPLKLNKDGYSTRTINVTVNMVYKKGRLKSYYISSIGGKKISKNRKSNKTFWIKERKNKVPKGYDYNAVTYCIRAEKIKPAKKHGKNKLNKDVKVKLCLYKSKIDKKHLVRGVRTGKTLTVK